MPSPGVSALSREDILVAAKKFQWHRQMPKWTVIVDGRELPARPLVLEAAGALPNDSTNSHQAVDILRNFGFSVRYEGRTLQPENNNRKEELHASVDELIDSLRGCLKGGDSLLEAWEREHRIEKDRLAR